METKTVDHRGRLTLGPEFAGKTVIVRKTKHGISITPAVVVAEHEAWLLKNPEAVASIRRGISQAAEGKFAASPVEIDEHWADLED